MPMPRAATLLTVTLLLNAAPGGWASEVGDLGQVVPFLERWVGLHPDDRSHPNGGTALAGAFWRLVSSVRRADRALCSQNQINKT